jgi:hypothetical protein
MYFVAIKCVEMSPMLLIQVLQEVYLVIRQKCLDANQQHSWKLWLWDDLDKSMLTQAFSQLEVIQRFHASEQRLKQAGPQGTHAVVCLERELLTKVRVHMSSRLTWSSYFARQMHSHGKEIMRTWFNDTDASFHCRP